MGIRSKVEVQLKKGMMHSVTQGLNIVYGGVAQDFSDSDDYCSDCIVILTVIWHFASFPTYYRCMQREDDANDKDGAAYDVDTEDSDSLEFYGPGNELFVLKLTNFGRNFLDGELIFKDSDD